MNPDFINATLGGLLIALSSILMMALLGKITGISGIFWQAVNHYKISSLREHSWRWLFLVGLLLGPLLVHYGLGVAIPAASEADWLTAALAGFIVGFGTKMGGGCTSGHGICGIGRFSKRSIVATVAFMFFGIVTVYLTRHVFSSVLLAIQPALQQVSGV